MLEEPTVLLPARTTAGVVHGDEAVQRVVWHLANARHPGILRPEIEHELSSSLMHVAVRAVDMAAGDVEKVRIDAIPLDHLGDAPLEMFAPRLRPEIHV